MTNLVRLFVLGCVIGISLGAHAFRIKPATANDALYAMTVNGYSYGQPSAKLPFVINEIQGLNWECKTYNECPESITITRVDASTPKE